MELTPGIVNSSVCNPEDARVGETQRIQDSAVQPGLKHDYKPDPIDLTNVGFDPSKPEDRMVMRRLMRGPIRDLPPILASQSSIVQPETEQIGPPQVCPPNDSYQKLVTKAWNNIYDPKKLGDLTELQNKFNCQLQAKNDPVYYANQALKATDDPYTRVMDKAESDAEKDENEGVFKGFGLLFADKSVTADPKLPSPLKLTGTVENSPAYRKGIRSGDYIVAIDGVALKGKTFDQAFDLIDKEKEQEFTISRNGKTFKHKMTAEETDVPSVKSKRLAGNIAYIQIKTFDQNDVSDELQEALKKHRKASGYIIDVRDNTGGFFEEAINSASLFVKNGKIVSTRTRIDLDEKGGTEPADAGGTDQQSPAVASDAAKGASQATANGAKKPMDFEKVTYRVHAKGLTETTEDENEGTKQENTKTRYPDLVDKPTVVLVNGDSASSSEVFTAALQQNGDAKVVGTKTFGKGIGQTIFYNQPESSTLRVTSFRYFTPKDNWLGDGHNEKIGIRPDFEVHNKPGVKFGSPQDRQLRVALQEIKKKIGTNKW